MSEARGSARARFASWAGLLTGAAAVLAWDRATKEAVLFAIDYDEIIPVFGDWFRLVHVRNTGAAFGFLRGMAEPVRTLFFGGMTLIAVFFVGAAYPRLPQRDRVRRLSLSLILGGALGNLWDRLTLGEVVDFLDFGLGTRRWPSFNIADSAIVVGVSLWVYASMMLARKGGKAHVS